MASKKSRWLIVGFGFNGFHQLDFTQDDISSQGPDTSHGLSHSLSTSSPRVLMDLSHPLSSVEVSSSWDALHVYTSEGQISHTLTTGRWSSIVRDAQKLLQGEDKVCKIVETPNGHLILHTQEKRIIVLNGLMEPEEWSSISHQVKEIGCLQDGKVYSLLTSGSVHKCLFDPPDSCKLQLSHDLPTNGHVISHMTCGADHTLLLAHSGIVLSFGIGTRGQLGHGDVLPRSEPSVIHALAGLPIQAIACGNWHSLVLSQSGDLYSWGWNEQGQLGLKRPPGPTVAVPSLVDIADNTTGDVSIDVTFVSIGCGSRHSAAVTEDGVLYCWGWNEYGQLGNGSLDSGKYRLQSVYCSNWCTVCHLTAS